VVIELEGRMELAERITARAAELTGEVEVLSKQLIREWSSADT
jgi:hypothetical protein